MGEVLNGDALSPDAVSSTATDPAALSEVPGEVDTETDEEAVAEAPEDAAAREPGEQALDDQATADQADPDPATILKRLNSFTSREIDAILSAASQFSSGNTSGLSIDPVMLGIVWASEGAPHRTSVTISPTETNSQRVKWLEIFDLLDFGDASADSVRAATISAVGLWAFGLDDLFAAKEVAIPDLATLQGLWAERLQSSAGWTGAVPFAKANPALSRPDSSTGARTLTFSTSEAVGFLVAMAARWTFELARVPAVLSGAGISIEGVSVNGLLATDPVLSYLAYNGKAERFVASIRAARFLQSFCRAVTEGDVLGGGEQTLQPMIDVLNRWRTALADGKTVIPMLKLLIDSSAVTHDGTNGLTSLQSLAESLGGNLPLESDLEDSARASLQLLQSVWATAAYFVVAHVGDDAPGSLLMELSNKGLDVALFQRSASGMNTVPDAISNFGPRVAKALEGSPPAAHWQVPEEP